MNSPSFSLTLIEQDKKYKQLTDEINAKRMFIINKKRELDKQKQENKYMNNVRNNYIQIYEHIVNEKMQEIKYMNILKKHLEDLTDTEQMVSDEIEQSNFEHSLIIKELKKLETELKQIL